MLQFRTLDTLVKIITLVVVLCVMNEAAAKNEYGVLANDPKLEALWGPSLKMPEPLGDGKIVTLNKTGFMTSEIDPFSQDFIKYSASISIPVLEIGSAYGIATIPALHLGATVIANDIEEKHLLILRNRVDPKYWGKLYLNKKRMPEELDFSPNSLGAVLMCRVAHFFSGAQMDLSISKAYKWLHSGGKLYIVTLSPYHYSLLGFAEKYNARWEEGIKWPGSIERMPDYVPHLKDHIPDFLHVLDHRPIVAALEAEGFVVEKHALFDYKRNQHKDRAGKGYFGIIAVKP